LNTTDLKHGQKMSEPTSVIISLVLL